MALIDPSLLVPFCSTRDFDAGGEHYTDYIICAYPDDWTTGHVQAAMELSYPVERCAHEYDCCANYYVKAPRLIGANAGVACIARPHILNI